MILCKMGDSDLMLSPHALGLGVTLVTNNMKEFTRVPELRLENWVD